MADDKELDEAKKTEKADKAENNKKSRKEKKLEKKLEKEKEKNKFDRITGWISGESRGACIIYCNWYRCVFVRRKGSVYPDSVYRADRGRAYGIQDLLWRRQIWHTKGRCTCFYLYLSGR